MTVTPTQWWNGAGWQAGRTFVTATLDAGTTSRTWSYGGFAPPAPQALQYWMTVRSFDAAGNASSYVYRDFKVSSDAEAPTVVVSAPVEGATLGLPGVDLWFGDGQCWGRRRFGSRSMTVTPTQWWNGAGWQAGRTFVTATLGAGTTWTYGRGLLLRDPQTLQYWMTVRSFDAAGNPSSYVYRNFEVALP